MRSACLDYSFLMYDCFRLFHGKQFVSLHYLLSVIFTGMGSNYYGQARNMGQQFQQQRQNLMNQGQRLSQQMAGKFCCLL